MVDLYGKCESLEDARRVFDSMEQHDIVSWTSIITGYAHESQDGDEAFLLFSSMQEQGFKPDRLACVAAIKASWPGERSSSLVDMYAKCGSLIMDIRRVFDKILDRDILSWNSFLFGCVYIGEDELALECYAALEVAPNSQTFLALLQVCRNLGDLKLGKLFHGQILRQGLEGSSVRISLLDFYCKCGSVEVAELVFESSIASPNTVAWNTLIAGHGAQGDAIAAFQAFRSMRRVYTVAELESKLGVVNKLSPSSHIGCLPQRFRKATTDCRHVSRAPVTSVGTRSLQLNWEKKPAQQW
ncbi:putative pentatricopeptide repeat-containing protein At3g13770, mitochondrial [Selaginella moellendorffii]|uniref:putative pentatricopeptide repeat-containing protein At3g13770, mitochondrial n=1 Tax=Selaginella moellendorffii TaxID=88036 RepID=UPI000D1C98D8|nr:putative pentatricopeptide repeat-containing protein At3g13770, mitochondrial [Selaginella moellendorffii]|eukprot:XP_024536957.1 putative pentatricopeptide repeat-containing protein At3g13770, mitochondrial [Selaginella moellendorffii]